jgi:phosphoglycolate phosphatase-like HAD superfamily hydrolase
VLTGGAGSRAMARAFEQLFGIPNAFGTIAMPGRTDRWLLARALDEHAIAASDPRVGRFRDVYLRFLTEELDRPHPPGTRKGVLPGVRELLDALDAAHFAQLALLTGNYEPAAKLKLEHFDLWRYFAAGAFGDVSIDRNELLAEALGRVERQTGYAGTPEATVVIGDTPHDVAVAKAGGARSIAVATGSHTVEQLRATGADYVFDDLSDLAQVLAALRVATLSEPNT